MKRTYEPSVFRTGLVVNGIVLIPENMKIVRGPMTEEHKRKISESVRKTKIRNKSFRRIIK
jgi:hypothetical protein